MNYAELQKQIDTAPTIEQCGRMGATHAAYGWSNRKCHWWPESHQIAYSEAYSQARKPWEPKPNA